MLFMGVEILGFDLGILIENIMRALFYFINTIIYRLIIYMYDIFIMLCNGRLLESEVVNQLTVRVGTILGVVMMFMVVFSFVQMLLNPETMNDKEKGVGNIIKKILIVIVMLGTSTYVFNLLTNIQVAVVESNAIANLLVPNEVNNDAFGSALSGSLFTAFYTSNVEEDSNDICTQEAFSKQFQVMIGLNPPNFEYGKACLYETTTDPTTNEEIHIREFNWLLCTIVGVAVVYFIFYYCISVGIRIVQLAALQIIAPMPIVSYLSPKKDNMFSKWAKIYFTTYIDVFIRIAIINFVVYLIAIILESWNNQDTIFWTSIGVDSSTPWLVTTLIGVIMIIALLLFAKKAPDLIKDLFPSSAGSIGFGIKSPKDLLKDTLDSPLAKPITAPIGFLGKRTLGGIDSAINGQGFWRGVGMSFFAGDFMQKYMPMTAENRKKGQEGRKEVKDIDNNWKKGEELKRKLEAAGVKNWTKAFDGTEETANNYTIIFKHHEFINSKMAVDRQKKVDEEYRFTQQAITSSGGFSEYLKLKGEKGKVVRDGVEVEDTVITINDKNYGKEEMYQFQDDMQKASDTLSGLKEVHESVRKQYQDDAKREDQYKFRKNNDINPANPPKITNPK